MELPQEMKTVGLDMVNLYENRIEVVMGLIRETVRLIKDCSNEQEIMINQLKYTLSKINGLRKKDFDGLMEGILNRRKMLEKEAKEAVEQLWKEEGEKVIVLRNVLLGDGIKNIESVKTNILLKQREAEKGLARILKELQREQEELNVALKRLLSKGELVRIKDVKAMVKAVNVLHREKGNGLDKMLEAFNGVNQEVTSTWERFFSAYEKQNIGYGQRSRDLGPKSKIKEEVRWQTQMI